MTEILGTTMEIIRVDLIIGFGLYSILLFIFRMFLSEKERINEFDKVACRTVVYLGLAYAAIWLILIPIDYYGITDQTERTDFLYRRFRGPYAFAFWIQPLFWIALTQLLRFRVMRKSLAYRILMSLLFIFTFERFVILTTSFHRDHQPMDWMLDQVPGALETIVGLTIKTLLFTLVAGIHYFAKTKLSGTKR